MISLFYLAFVLVGCTILAAAEEQEQIPIVFDGHESTGGKDVIRTTGQAHTKPLHYNDEDEETPATLAMNNLHSNDEEDEDILASLAMNLDHQNEMTQFIAINSKQQTSLRGSSTNHKSDDEAEADDSILVEEDYLTSLAMANESVESSRKPLRIQLTIHNGHQLEEDDLTSLATAAVSTQDEMNELMQQFSVNEVATSQRRFLLRSTASQRSLSEEDDLTSLANSGIATTKEEMKQVLRSL